MFLFYKAYCDALYRVCVYCLLNSQCIEKCFSFLYLFLFSSPGVLLVIAFVVFYVTAIGGFGDPNNGLAIIFSMGFGIVFITAIAFAYPLGDSKVC